MPDITGSEYRELYNAGKHMQAQKVAEMKKKLEEDFLKWNLCVLKELHRIEDRIITLQHYLRTRTNNL